MGRVSVLWAAVHQAFIGNLMVDVDMKGVVAWATSAQVTTSVTVLSLGTQAKQGGRIVGQRSVCNLHIAPPKAGPTRSKRRAALLTAPALVAVVILCGGHQGGGSGAYRASLLLSFGAERYMVSA